MLLNMWVMNKDMFYFENEELFSPQGRIKNNGSTNCSCFKVANRNVAIQLQTSQDAMVAQQQPVM